MARTLHLPGSMRAKCLALGTALCLLLLTRSAGATVCSPTSYTFVAPPSAVVHAISLGTAAIGLGFSGATRGWLTTAYVSSSMNILQSLIVLAVLANDRPSFCDTMGEKARPLEIAWGAAAISLLLVAIALDPGNEEAPSAAVDVTASEDHVFASLRLAL